MSIRKTVGAVLLVSSFAFPTYARDREEPRHDPISNIIRFVIAHLPPWLHAIPTDDFPLPPRP